MSCKCFNVSPPDSRKSFSEKVELSKCKCQARLFVSENKSKFYIDSEANTSFIDKIKIDGFLDRNTDVSKCDYLFIYKNAQNVEQTYIFVELKGVDVKHAIEQLDNSIDAFYAQDFLKNKRVRAAIVAYAFPRDSGTYRKAEIILRKKWNAKKDMNFDIDKSSRIMSYNPFEDKYLKS